METSITRLLIKSCCLSDNASRCNIVIRLVPKYFGTVFSIGLDKQDIAEEKEATFVSLLRIDDEITYTDRSTSKLYKFIFENFNGPKVIYIKTKWGAFCVGKGLLIAGTQLLAISAYRETIARIIHGREYETLLEFDRTLRVYIALPTKMEKHTKELYNYMKKCLSSYVVGNFNFVEWI